MIKNKQHFLGQSAPTNKSQVSAGSESRIHKKISGNSQFIRSKFDIDYSPKLKVFKIGKSPFSQQNIKKRQVERQKYSQIALLINKTQEQVKNGKKIIIDWSQKNNFRTTRFPNINQSFGTRRSNTQQAISNELSRSIKSKNYIDYLDKHTYSPPNKQIAEKSDHLRELISESILQKKRKRLRCGKLKKKLNHKSSVPSQQNQQSQLNSNSSVDPHFNYQIIEDVQRKQKQFFKNNNNQIMTAIDYERKMGESLNHEKVGHKGKIKLQQIHQRIINKSKLTILKSDLARKFKEIRDGILDGPQAKNKNFV